ncbi:Hsp70 family protein [Nocardia tengchongensis]
MSIGTVNTVTAVVDTDTEPQVHSQRTATALPGAVGDAPVDSSAAARIAELTARLAPPTDADRNAVLACPAVYSTAETAAVRRALDAAGRPDIALVPEPVAAAAWFATREAMTGDEAVLVYDLGGATLDAAVVRIDATARNIQVLGRPVRSSGYGGRAFGAILARYVHDSTADTDSPGLTGELPTGKVDELRAEHIRSSVPLMRECVRVAGLATVDRILLVGGASRPDVVARVLADELGRPVVTVPDPAQCVALGAAVLALRAGAGENDTAASTPGHRRSFTRAATTVAIACAAAVPILGGVTEPGVDTADQVAAPALSTPETPAIALPMRIGDPTAFTEPAGRPELPPVRRAAIVITDIAVVERNSPVATILTDARTQPAPETAGSTVQPEPDSTLPEVFSSTVDPLQAPGVWPATPDMSTTLSTDPATSAAPASPAGGTPATTGTTGTDSGAADPGPTTTGPSGDTSTSVSDSTTSAPAAGDSTSPASATTTTTVS